MDKIYTNETNRKPKIILITLALLLLIISVGWVTFTYSKHKSPASNSTITNCGNGICGSGESIANCPIDCKTLNTSKVDGSLSLCESGVKDTCLAISKKNTSYCSETTSDSCLTKTTILFDIFKNKDKNSCAKVKGMKEEDCFNLVDSITSNDINKCKDGLCKDIFRIYSAYSKKDINLCDTIIDSETKNLCKLYITSNMNYCDYTSCTDEYNIKMREVSGNISYCNKVLQPEGKQACLDYKKD